MIFALTYVALEQVIIWFWTSVSLSKSERQEHFKVCFLSSELKTFSELCKGDTALPGKNLHTQQGCKCQYNKVREEPKVKVLMATRIHRTGTLFQGLL